MKTLQTCRAFGSIQTRRIHHHRNRMSSQFLPLVRKVALDDMNDTGASVDLLSKAGFFRQSSPGIYSLLPFGVRTVEKIQAIINEELQSIGCQKIAMPLLLGADNWKKTGRWDASKGEFFRLKDRRNSDMLLAPTHEEEITQLVAAELQSPKQLPIRLYQIGYKFRDEARPRAGLLRGREFIMKDLYTFDASVEAARMSYENVARAYERILTRIGMPFVVAEADTGNIGGKQSHEYHLISPIGEDTLLTCSGCGYTANEELALGVLATEQIHRHKESKHPDRKFSRILDMLGVTVDPKVDVDVSLLEFSSLNSQDGSTFLGTATVLVPKGRQINFLKVEKSLEENLQDNHSLVDVHKASSNDDVIPTTTPSDMHILIDESLTNHIASNHSLGKMHKPSHLRITTSEDMCSVCTDHRLESVRAIEVGHTFYLGTKYSSLLDCGFRPSPGAEKQPVEMGCYGLGISRLVGAIAEARHDKRGIAWPQSVAPYSACIVTTDDKDQGLSQAADDIYNMLAGPGRIFENDVMMDDRLCGFGRKMTDAELVGYPFIIVLGNKFKNNAVIEVHQRVHGDKNNKVETFMQDLTQALALGLNQ